MGKEHQYNYNYEVINYPDLDYIAGFDEAGRGAIAGPIVVAAVILPPRFESDLIKDSKKLSAKQRERAYQLIVEQACDYAITIVELNVIEDCNPRGASIKGMETAFVNLTLTPKVCLIDFEKPNFLNYHGISKSLIQGDQKSINVAAASILAKVLRDRIMVGFHEDFPEYQFATHKGYYTKLHAATLKKYGACKIHRKSYLPVKKAIKNDKV